MRQSVDIHAELRGFRNFFRAARIERVQSFQYQDLIRLQRQRIADEAFLAQLKVLGRQHDRLTADQCFHRRVEQFQIQTFDILIIMGSIRQSWTVFAVEEEIVH